MAGMQMALVDDDQPLGREGFGQLVFDRVAERHVLVHFSGLYARPSVDRLRASGFPQSLQHSDLSILVVAACRRPIISAMKLNSKYFDRIRTRRKANRKPKSAPAPVCQWDGCEKQGVHRAPVGRNAEGAVFHVLLRAREANTTRATIISPGLSDTEVARYQKEAMTGHRPTWTMGVNKDARMRRRIAEQAPAAGAAHACAIPSASSAGA